MWLLITAETYSKYIDREDRSLRTIFSDAAAATLIEAGDQPSLRAFRYGTDGSGAGYAARHRRRRASAEDAHAPRHRKRWKSALYMDGPSLMNFTVGAVPQVIEQILDSAQLERSDIQFYLMHQATLKMLQQLQQRLDLTDSELPICLEKCGNTVSSHVADFDFADARREASCRGGKSVADRFRSWLVMGRLRLDGLDAGRSASRRLVKANGPRHAHDGLG